MLIPWQIDLRQGLERVVSLASLQALYPLALFWGTAQKFAPVGRVFAEFQFECCPFRADQSSERFRWSGRGMLARLRRGLSQTLFVTVLVILFVSIARAPL